MRDNTMPSHDNTLPLFTMPSHHITSFGPAPLHHCCTLTWVASLCHCRTCQNFATAKLLSGKPLLNYTKLGTAVARPCLTLPCLCRTFITSQCLCLSLLNDTLPQQNPAPQHHALPLLDCASPYPTQLDRNIHCLCFSFLY